MKQAIISGANGLVGYELTKFFISRNIKVICIGRKDFEQTQLHQLPLDKKNYICLAVEKIIELPNLLKKINYNFDDETVFFNFAWRGLYKLTDGVFEDQINNAVFAAEAVKVAKKIGCNKFINVGTAEEYNAENYLRNNYPKRHNQNQTFYTLAKLTSRDMCSITAYLEKIDYIHTRLSVPLDPTLKKGNYISTTLKKILNSEEFVGPRSNQLYDIIFLEEVVRAYFSIGFKGVNKANYFIGTGKPLTLNQYFEYFKKIIKKDYAFPQVSYKEKDLKCFDTKSLEIDTGFKIKNEFKDIQNYLHS